MSQRACVYYRDKKAGTLDRTPSGYEFHYDPAYLAEPGAAPISLAMPLRSEKYAAAGIFPFFAGLLPEGWLLDHICAAAKIPKEDKFRLLLHIGRDPVGAVRVLPEAIHG